MQTFEKNTISKMVLLTRHDEASKAFGTELFYTDEPMHYFTRHAGFNVVIQVPRGFLTDGATIPKAFQKFLPVWDTYYQAAVFHDYLCEYLTAYRLPDMAPMKLSRSEADKYFGEIMKVLNTNPIKRKIVHGAVVAYAHAKSIIYPSATMTKREFENRIREDLDMRDLARENQKK